MPCDPSLDLAREVRRHGNIVVALAGFRVPDPILTFLTLFEGLVDSELHALEILDPQHERLSGSQSAHGKDAQHQMFPRRCMSKDRAQLVDG